MLAVQVKTTLVMVVMVVVVQAVNTITLPHKRTQGLQTQVVVVELVLVSHQYQVNQVVQV